MASCLLLLIVAIPLLLAHLPDHVDEAAARSTGAEWLVPMVALLVGSVAVASRVPMWVSGLVWGTAMTTMLACIVGSTPPGTWGLAIVLPLGLCILRQPTTTLVAGTLIGPLAIVITRGWGDVHARPAFGVGLVADTFGLIALGAWAVWLATEFPAFVAQRKRLRLQRDTAKSLDDGITRDRDWLHSVAHTIADPSLEGPVQGVGVGDDALAMAARIEGPVVLLGWIEGEPLATMTVGWALCAAARAGLQDPVELARLAREQFDEVVTPPGIRWVALWNRRTGVLVSSEHTSTKALRRYVLTPRGPMEIGPRLDLDTTHTVDRLFEDAAIERTDGHTPDGAVLKLVIGGSCLAFALVTLWFAQSGEVWLATVAAFIGAHRQIEAAEILNARSVAHSASRLQERAELHDDLRFELARLHGSLLAYRIEVGECVATAHRLRGEVLDGTFADMLVDRDATGRILAGEVAGRGIAARFLGLAAQMGARVLVRDGSDDPIVLTAVLAQQVCSFGRGLRFPVRLRLGSVEFRSDGCCEGWGVLNQFVRVDAGAAANTSVRANEVVDTATLDDTHRIYLTPNAALPGPEDDAPALARSEAGKRIIAIVMAGRWDPRSDSLPTLFSEVFDGQRAPAHGTLIELSRSRPREHKDPSEHDDGNEQLPAPSLAAV